MKSKFLNLTLSLAAILVMGGCGSSDSDDSTGSGVDDPEDVAPISTYSDCVGEYTSPDGTTYTEKMGADGKFQIICSGGYPEIAFADGVTSLTVTQITVVETVDFTEDGNSVEAEVTRNVADGTQVLVGTSSEYGSFNCTENYDSTLPATVYSTDDLGDLAEFSDLEPTSSDCPAWINEEDDEEEDDDMSSDFEGTFMENIKVTDTDGITSNVSMYDSLEK